VTPPERPRPTVDGRLAFFLTFSLALNLILTLLLVSQVLVVRDEVRALPERLVTKDNVAALRPLRIQEILDARCTTCHTDRRFSRVLGWERQPILNIVARMATHPGASIPAEEFALIQAALVMLQCTRCHSEAVLSRLAMQTPDEQVSTIRRMQRLPESGIRPDQIPEIVQAFRTLSGQR
jgi:hypothetical protein